MYPYVIQDLASVQNADRVQQADQTRLCRQVRAARSPRPRIVAGKGFQWLSVWFARQRGARPV